MVAYGRRKASAGAAGDRALLFAWLRGWRLRRSGAWLRLGRLPISRKPKTGLLVTIRGSKNRSGTRGARPLRLLAVDIACPVKALRGVVGRGGYRARANLPADRQKPATVRTSRLTCRFRRQSHQGPMPARAGFRRQRPFLRAIRCDPGFLDICGWQGRVHFQK